jgi:polysaccharide export outer membrane protein
MKMTIRLAMCAAWAALLATFTSISALAQDRLYEDRLGAGDVIRVQVYQSPDLSLETRILETGNISYPLIGSTKVAGLTIPEAEAVIAKALKTGGFIQQPQVTIAQLQIRRKTVTVLGAVGRPGLYPLDNINTHLSNILAAAGGISQGGSDTVILTGKRDGKPMRQEIDVAATYLDDKLANDVVLASGDTVYVHRAPSFYVYGEAGKPGPYRLERNMTVMQALVTAGGPTQRGTERNLRLNRRSADGSIKESRPELTDLVQPDDVIFVRESLF